VRILFVTTEIRPYSKVGKLAEYSHHLPRELKAKGNDISIITPYYRTLLAEREDIKPINDEWIDIWLGSERYGIRYLKAESEDTSVPVIFVECEPMFGRDGIYENPADGKIFADNHKRFMVLQNAALEYVARGHFSCDLIHLNDHATALLPAWLKTRYADNEALKGVKTLLTIHDVKYQGSCSLDYLAECGIDVNMFSEACKNDEGFNCLRGGIALADRVNAVSPTYAKETLLSDEYGAGLTACLQARGEDYFGILNGVDYTYWNSKKDEHIPSHFGLSSSGDKLGNKMELLANHGLDHSNAEKTPLIGIVCELTEAKGMQLVAQAIDKMLPWDIRMIIAGSGDPRYHRMFEQTQMRYPNKLGLNLTPSIKLVHQMMAGCDFLLVPSRIEPCGEHQFYSMRYGSIPIARATGGLADSIEDYIPESKKGWGFLFDRYDAESLLKTVWRAISLYKSKSNFQSVQKRAMRLDFSWTTCAGKYTEVYKDMVG